MNMDIVVKGVASTYEYEHLARVFFPGARIRMCKSTRGTIVYVRMSKEHIVAGLRMQNGKCVLAKEGKPKEPVQQKLALCKLMYALLKAHCGVHPPWGMLTGIRPVNLLRKKLLNSQEKAREYFLSYCDVTQEKYDMACEIVKCQKPYLASATEKTYSLYISIPFCPSRCNYCSFVSQNIQNEGHLVTVYLDKLKRELEITAKLAKENGLVLATIYIGGGTPTALSAAQLERLLCVVAKYYDTVDASEYTVEAGRADCTDAEKLAILKKYGVTRVSINPQSLCDDVLREINRQHTAADVVRCFNEARSAGHGNINMDIIAGLTGDCRERFVKTVEKVVALAPENITVHSLTLKRAAALASSVQAKGQNVAVMLDAAYKMLYDAGYRPYYLYRQKSGVDNLENTGWALPGKQGLYNIFVMEEVQTILAAGAGAVTKLVNTQENRIVRIYNHKLPKEYIDSFDEVIKRKEGVSEFYAGNLDT